MAEIPWKQSRSAERNHENVQSWQPQEEVHDGTTQENMVVEKASGRDYRRECSFVHKLATIGSVARSGEAHMATMQLGSSQCDEGTDGEDGWNDKSGEEDDEDMAEMQKSGFQNEPPWRAVQSDQIRYLRVHSTRRWQNRWNHNWRTVGAMKKENDSWWTAARRVSESSRLASEIVWRCWIRVEGAIEEEARDRRIEEEGTPDDSHVMLDSRERRK